MDTENTPEEDAPAPRRGAELPDTLDGARVAVLADSLDCLTEADLVALAKIKRSTAEAWRKRGSGPEYILLGNRVLYPRDALREFLNELRRGRHPSPRSLL